MPKFMLNFQDSILDLKQFVTAKKKQYYDSVDDKMVFSIVVNDGLNEVFNTRYEWKFESYEQLEYHWGVFLKKLEQIDWIVIL